MNTIFLNILIVTIYFMGLGILYKCDKIIKLLEDKRSDNEKLEKS